MMMMMMKGSTQLHLHDMQTAKNCARGSVVAVLSSSAGVTGRHSILMTTTNTVYTAVVRSDESISISATTRRRLMGEPVTDIALVKLYREYYNFLKELTSYCSIL